MPLLGSDLRGQLSLILQDRHQLRYELDLNSWNFRIWGVAASGFLTDSYVVMFCMAVRNATTG